MQVGLRRRYYYREVIITRFGGGIWRGGGVKGELEGQRASKTLQFRLSDVNLTLSQAETDWSGGTGPVISEITLQNEGLIGALEDLSGPCFFG